jgi:4-amino-4-deoxy-L-arabinose transferase-like glycosyltransferase
MLVNSVGKRPLPAERSRRVVFAASLALVLAAAALWWSGFLTQGNPFVYHPDEPSVMGRAIKIAYTGNYNPGWFHYPTLVIYLQTLVAQLVHWLYGVPLKPGAIVIEGAAASVLPHYFAGRGVIIGFSLGTTALTMLITRRLVGLAPAVLAGVIFAASGLVRRNAVYVTVDMPLTFFVTLSIWFLVRALDDPGKRPELKLFVLAAISGSLAGGTKYNGALILALLPVVLLARRGFRPRSFFELILLGAVALALFVISTPFSLLDPATFWDRELGLTSVFIHYGTTHLGADVGPSGPKALDTILNTVGPFTMLAIAGLGAACSPWLARPLREQTWLLIGSVAVLAFPVVIASIYFERNCLPFVPALIALACVGLVAVVRAAKRLIRFAPGRQVVACALLALPLTFQARSAWEGLRFELSGKNHEDTRTTAYHWALRNLPRGARIYREAFTPHLHFSDRFTVGSCFSLGDVSLETLNQWDYVVTSSVLWSAYPDLAKTTYGHFFANRPVYELPGTHGYPSVRIDRVVSPNQPADLEAFTVFRLSSEDGFADLLPIQDVELVTPPPGRAGALQIDAVGNDASLLLPELPDLGRRWFLLRVSLTSPKRTHLQLFYRPRGTPQFDEEHSVRVVLFPGKNRVDLRFGPADVVGRIRLDPADKPSLYRVEELSLYAWSAQGN